MGLEPSASATPALVVFAMTAASSAAASAGAVPATEAVLQSVAAGTAGNGSGTAGLVILTAACSSNAVNSRTKGGNSARIRGLLIFVFLLSVEGRGRGPGGKVNYFLSSERKAPTGEQFPRGTVSRGTVSPVVWPRLLAPHASTAPLLFNATVKPFPAAMAMTPLCAATGTVVSPLVLSPQATMPPLLFNAALWR